MQQDSICPPCAVPDAAVYWIVPGTYGDPIVPTGGDSDSLRWSRISMSIG